MPIRGFLDLRGADKTILRHCRLCAPATKLTIYISSLRVSLTGGFVRSSISGSTVEARGCVGLRAAGYAHAAFSQC